MSSPLRRLAALTVLTIVVALSAASPATAQPPAIEAGECLYLVGAPPGAPAAETEETTQGTRIYDGCTLPASVEVDADGPYRVRAWMTEEPSLGPSRNVCELVGRVGHQFVVVEGGEDRLRAWVRVSGTARGLIESTLSSENVQHLARVVVIATELGPDGRPAEVARKVAFAKYTVSNERRRLDESFGVRLDFDARPGATYSVELLLELEGRANVDLIDFGRPGTDRFAGYDQVEACLGRRGSADAAARSLLEQALYRRECYPEIWLPEEQGGRLEEARDLVSLRLGQAESSGAPGIHGAGARRELERADEAIASGDHQRACQALTRAIHALTTP